jgi:hypothetical protein
MASTESLKKWNRRAQGEAGRQSNDTLREVLLHDARPIQSPSPPVPACCAVALRSAVVLCCAVLCCSLKSQLQASQATSSSLAAQVKEGLDREASLEAEVCRLKEELARAALAPLSGSEEL